MRECLAIVCRSLKNQKGQTMVELGLIAVFISIAAIAVFPAIQTALLNTFTTISTSL